jgi:hypothetical protein
MLSKILKVSTVMVLVVCASSFALASFVPPSGAVLWLKADAGVTYNGVNLVSQWDDQSGLLNNAASVVGYQPTYVSSGPNGQPVVRFDGSSSYMSVGANSTLDLGQGAGKQMTVFLVESQKGPGSGYQPVIDKSNGTGSSNVDYTVAIENSKLFWGTGDSNDSVAWMGITKPSVDTFHIVAADMNATASASGTKDLWFDGSLAGSGAYVNDKNPAVSNPLLIGTYAGFNHYYDGDLAEVLIYTRTLSAGELNSVGYYLGQKYGIPNSYTNAAPEPSTLTLLAAGLVSLLAYAWRKRR